MPSAQANGLTFEYESFGKPEDPVILLIMGLGVQMILWPEEFCAMLAARGYRVIRFDNRDVGLSTQLDHLGSPSILLQYAKYLLHLPLKAPYLIDDMARDTMALVDALGIARPHLVGASMGGMIAQNAAAHFPDRVASLTSIMSTTGNRKLPPPEKRALNALMQKPAKKGDVAAAAARLKKLLRAIGSQTHPTEEAELTGFCERHASRAHNPPGQMRQLVAIAASGDRTSTVQRIKAPTLVIHGTEDPLLLPECGRATAKAVEAGGGTAKLVELEGMGHDLPRPLWPQLADLIAEHCRAADRASTGR
jgi:proline iminopeptidase